MRNKDRDCHREIKVCPAFAQVGRRKVDRDFCTGEWQFGVLERTSNAFTSFLHSGIWQAHDHEAWKPLRNITLDINTVRIESDNCGR